MPLTKDQLAFLERELHITEGEIIKMTKDEWHAVREECVDIEVDETISQGYDAEDTERNKLACSLVDTTYSMLRSLYNTTIT